MDTYQLITHEVKKGSLTCTQCHTSTSSSLTVAITALSATDNIGVTGYLLEHIALGLKVNTGLH